MVGFWFWWRLSSVAGCWLLTISTGGREQREEVSSLLTVTKALVPFVRGVSLWPPVIFPKASTLSAVTLEARVSLSELVRHRHSVYNTVRQLPRTWCHHCHTTWCSCCGQQQSEKTQVNYFFPFMLYTTEINLGSEVHCDPGKTDCVKLQKLINSSFYFLCYMPWCSHWGSCVVWLRKWIARTIIM